VRQDRLYKVTLAKDSHFQASFFDIAFHLRKRWGDWQRLRWRIAW